MKRRLAVPLLLVILFARPAIASSGLDARISDTPLDSREARVIVRFTGEPLVYAGPRAASSHREVFERFRRDLTALERPALAKDASRPRATIHREFSNVFFGVAARVPRSLVAGIRQFPYVAAVHEDREVRIASTDRVAVPSATLVRDMRPGVDAQSLASNGAGVVVAVIDTGIDYTHPALGGGFGPGHKVAGGYDFSNDDDDPFDDHGHGTHVAGIIAGESDQIIGVAPGATLYAYKVLNRYGSGYFSDVIAGIDRSADPNGDLDTSDHVDVANLSLSGSGTRDDDVSLAVDNAVAAGVVMCVAAGNSGGFAIVGSPGTARDAITVAAVDDNSTVASFSSRGPTPRDLDFKPDVAAPGVAIYSSIAGGGYATLSGTSMATPHVAGACALLESLHPDWSPAQIKYAITTSAKPIGQKPLERGAGRVSAARAAAATIFSSESGLSFGIDPASSGTYEQSRTFVLTNSSTSPRSFTIAQPPSTPGMTVAASPSAFTIAPSSTQTVEVHLTIDNVAIRFPNDHVLDGAISLASGSDTINVPWFVVRSARATIEYFDLWSSPIGYSGSTRIGFAAYSGEQAEAFVPPGNRWEFFLTGVPAVIPFDGDADMNVFVLPDRLVDGDNFFPVYDTDAPYVVTLDATDENGIRIGDLPAVEGVKRHHTFLRVQRGRSSFDLYLGRGGTIGFSAIPPNYTFTLNQGYVDLDNMRFYNVLHDPLTSINGPLSLSKTVSDYEHVRMHWKPRTNDDQALTVCEGIFTSSLNRFVPTNMVCLARQLGRGLPVDYFTTSDDEIGLLLASSSTSLPAIRGEANGVVISDDALVGPEAPRLPNDSEATVGDAPLHPYMFVNAINGTSAFALGDAGFIGPLGETRSGDLAGTQWKLKDSNGNTVATGDLRDDSGTAITPRNGYELVAVRDGIAVDGHHGRATIDISFSPSGEIDAPSIGFMKVVDASGAINDKIAKNEPASLRFSAGDFSGTSFNAIVAEVRPQSTKAFYRENGAASWQPLSLVLESAETSRAGSVTARLPLGDIYRADLSSVTAGADKLVDLKIEFEDEAGNHVTWTQEPAFMVGDVPVPPRHRGVRP